jgi:hypothetical protein
MKPILLFLGLALAAFSSGAVDRAPLTGRLPRD